MMEVHCLAGAAGKFKPRLRSRRGSDNRAYIAAVGDLVLRRYKEGSVRENTVGPRLSNVQGRNKESQRAW